ncbi:MAG: hypothetical protein R3C05_15435 [Pirellulaceae bacterium]
MRRLIYCHIIGQERARHSGDSPLCARLGRAVVTPDGFSHRSDARQCSRTFE